MKEEIVTQLVYLVASILFIQGLKGLTHPRTAVRGNLLAAIGMLLAILITLIDHRITSFQTIFAGIVLGSVIGAVLAYRAPMTAMPQVVAIFNGFGGAASALASGIALEEVLYPPAGQAMEPITMQVALAAAFGTLIGAIAFTGSMVAFGKLQGWVHEKPILFPARHLINGVLGILCLALCVYMGLDCLDGSMSMIPFWLLFATASLLGILLVIPIGGADMPVIISLLNAYSGIAAAAVGWVINNSVLIIAGSLVGAAGFILTMLMSKAMNRSLANVMFAGVGTGTESKDKSQEVYEGRVKSASPEEVAMLMDGARRIVIVPGYGMAVAQAQHAVKDLTKLLENRGVEVEYAIHPVAGRMPGHMNVLLADAGIPYDKLKEMDEINPSFAQTDVVLVIGGNDVVNPLARIPDPSNPISGMPILDVDHARTVVIIKRSLSPGFAGIPNPLFAADNTLMLFGDARDMAIKLTSALKDL